MVFTFNRQHCELLIYKEVSEHQWYLGCEQHRAVSREEAIHDWDFHSNGSGLTHAQEFTIHYRDHLQAIEEFIIRHENAGDLSEILTNEQVHALLKD